MHNRIKKLLVIAVLAAFTVNESMAQSGVTGINAANSTLRTYIDPVSDLTLAIGAVVGIIGGIIVFMKWNSGDKEISKDVMSWGGSCIFLLLVSVIIKSFFGV
ncbi:DUF4134 family protein [Mucilaginibacter arboris]|uniref:DUF4134 domain-containing protein n=1 Tax=Mucilaginibacter arboris TaxID=2682090 RepID=A0A7K1T0E3_9SPHI|nr:DUF4134 family protein [Mucilaginibacter arboris]MVN23029.1 DUF4134 domain-containing protein [Mucilaginibacter arboris]